MALSLDRLSWREKTLLGVSGIVIFLAVGHQVVVRPIVLRIQGLSRDIETMEAEVKAGDRVLAQKNEISNRFTMVREHVSQAMPGVDPGADMLSEIERIVTSCGANLLTRKIQGVEKGEFFEEHAVKIDLEGTMPALMTLLYQLETSPQLLRVRRIDLTSTESGGQNKKCSMLITKTISI